MKRINNFKSIGMLVIAIGLIGISVSLASTSFDYRFKVHNTTKFRITKIMVSEDGNTAFLTSAMAFRPVPRKS